jgi:hypothetical protein
MGFIQLTVALRLPVHKKNNEIASQAALRRLLTQHGTEKAHISINYLFMTHRFVIQGQWVFKIQLFWAYKNLPPKSYARWWRNILPRGNHQIHRCVHKKNLNSKQSWSKWIHSTHSVFYFSTICFNTAIPSATRFPKLSLPTSFLDQPL